MKSHSRYGSEVVVAGCCPKGMPCPLKHWTGLGLCGTESNHGLLVLSSWCLGCRIYLAPSWGLAIWHWSLGRNIVSAPSSLLDGKFCCFDSALGRCRRCEGAHALGWTECWAGLCVLAGFWARLTLGWYLHIKYGRFVFSVQFYSDFCFIMLLSGTWNHLSITAQTVRIVTVAGVAERSLPFWSFNSSGIAHNPVIQKRDSAALELKHLSRIPVK